MWRIQQGQGNNLESKSRNAFLVFPLSPRPSSLHSFWLLLVFALWFLLASGFLWLLAFGVVVLASSSWIFRGRFHQGSIKVTLIVVVRQWPRWGGLGWGGDGTITFLAHVHIFDAMPVFLLCYGDHGGVGWGQGSTYRTKNNKCRSFPPALPLHTYTRVFAHNMIADDVCSLPAVSTNHIFWYIHMRFHKSYLLLVAFLNLQSIFDLEEWHAFCGVWVTFTWPNIAFTYSAPWSTYAFVPDLKLPDDSCEARFPLEKETTPGRGWQHHMSIHSDLWTQDALYLRKHNESEPEECGRISATRVFLKKTRNVGAVGRESNKSTGTLHARQVLLEKAHRIWKRFRDARFSWKKIRSPGAVGRGSYEFTVTRNAKGILPEKAQGIWGGWYSAHFSLKNTTISPGVGGREI